MTVLGPAGRELPVYPVKSCHAGVALLLFNRVYSVGIIILRSLSGIGFK